MTLRNARAEAGPHPTKFGLVGLGRIGRELTLQAIERGHQVIVHNRSRAKIEELAGRGATPAWSIEHLVGQLDRPRVVFVYVPHGEPTDQVSEALAARLEHGDVLVDGGNSHWKNSMDRHRALAARGVHFLDVGTSGGVEGARHGACFMVGGDQDAFAMVRPILASLAVEGGVLHAGPAGAGHFVKLIHNAIEFGMLQAIGEGVDLLARSDYALDLAAVFHNWRHGSVIRGWLVDLMERGLREHALDDLSARVEDTREVRWAVEYALDKEAWIPVIAQSELALYRYRDPDSVAGKAVALMRHGFGLHPLPMRGGGGRST